MANRSKRAKEQKPAEQKPTVQLINATREQSAELYAQGYCLVEIKQAGVFTYEHESMIEDKLIILSPPEKRAPAPQ